MAAGFPYHGLYAVRFAINVFVGSAIEVHASLHPPASTGVLLTLAQEFQDQQLLLLKKRRGKQQPRPNPKHGEQAAGGRSS